MRAKTPGKGRTGDVLAAAVFLGLAGMIFHQTTTVFEAEGAASGGAMDNAAMYPEFLAAALVVLALLQIIRTVRGGSAGGAPGGAALAGAMGKDSEGAPPPGAGHGVRMSKIDRRRHLVKALICLAAFAIYLLILAPLGYQLATPLLMGVTYYVLGVRNVIHAIALGVATSILMSLFFELLLNVVLPVGRFGIAF